LADARAERGHLALGDTPVQADAPRRRHPPVEDVAVEGVDEAVTPADGPVGPLLDARGVDEVSLPREPLAAIVELLRVGLERGGHGGDRELRPEDAGGFEGLTVLGLERLELVLDHLAQAVGHGRGERLDPAPEHPPAGLLGEESLAEREVDHVDEEERMAVGAVVDQAGEVVVDLAAREAAAQGAPDAQRGGGGPGGLLPAPPLARAPGRAAGGSRAGGSRRSWRRWTGRCR